ncbi:MAG TPA: adenosine deaminase [Conexibacter sp.]|nr:adenosine deaminase [Conexibacter sp.]
MRADDRTRSLAALPKAHLHLHVEGCMRPATLAELAAEHGVPVPVVEGFGDFAAFEGMYGAACDVLRSERDLRRLVRETVEDARADGAWYVEPAIYAPAHRALLGSDEAVVELMVDELLAAGRELGVGVGALIAGDRTMPLEECMEQARIAARWAGRGVVAFGLAADEAGYPPEPFAPAFAIAREAGLISAPHAGELAGPESIRGALDALGADRIQHGVRSIEDPRLVARIAEAGVCLDVCPTSNALLGVYPRVAEHPLPALLEAGVRCSLNADDSLLFGPGLLEEYELCRAELALDDAAFAAIARASLEASGAARELVARASAQIDAWLAADPEHEPAADPA